MVLLLLLPRIRTRRRRRMGPQVVEPFSFWLFLLLLLLGCCGDDVLAFAFLNVLAGSRPQGAAHQHPAAAAAARRRTNHPNVCATCCCCSGPPPRAVVRSSSSRTCISLLAHRQQKRTNDDDEDQPPEQLFSAPAVGRSGSTSKSNSDRNNWIERSSFSSTLFGEKGDGDGDDDDTTTRIEYYDMGLDGRDWQTGALSKRIYQAMVERVVPAATPRSGVVEMQRTLQLVALDQTAQQAVQAALKQSGLELAAAAATATATEQGNPQQWGEVESIRILMDDDDDDVTPTPVYDDFDECVDDHCWTPGTAFSFVARHVPARPLQQEQGTLDNLLRALDPDGTLQQQASDAGMILPVADDITSLAQMAWENRRRVEEDAPRGCDDTVFAGTDAPGYRVIAADELLLQQQQEKSTTQVLLHNQGTVLHVMDALVSHGCLIVDLGDDAAVELAGMWDTAADFFANHTETAPPLQTIKETGSPHAKVGYAAYTGMQFLETRLRSDGTLLPTTTMNATAEHLRQSFQNLARVAQSITEIAVASASQEAQVDPHDAVRWARRLVAELLDDGQSIVDPEEQDEEEPQIATSVSMSPHRLCRYSNEGGDGDDNSNNNNNKSKSKAGTSSATKEIFGAHTDSTFLTAVPVANVAGLEVYDEAAEQWYRPELAARRHWRAVALSLGHNPDGWTERIAILQQQDDNDNDTTTAAPQFVTVPWHARYAVFMPGELLQLATRNEIMAAVHRVVAASDASPRLSAPVLFRGRSNRRWDCARYLGGCADSALLQECDGQRMEDIYDALQK